MLLGLDERIRETLRLLERNDTLLRGLTSCLADIRQGMLSIQAAQRVLNDI
jgi:hypothetical protein